MNHPVFNYLVILAFCFLGAALIFQGYRLSRKGQHFLGIPPIRKAWFLTGKICLFASWALFLAKAIEPSLGWLIVFPSFPFTAMVLLIPGSVITSVSFYHLGMSLKVGLPRQDTTLQTRGLYRYSRNPLYLGIYLITFASIAYFPDIVNIILGVSGIIFHHLITLSEEKFLSSRFGPSYDEYKKRVRRYL